jgi:hypothetical protein
VGAVPRSVRLDPKTEALLSRLARVRGRSKSHIIREAIARLAEEQTEPAQPTAYDLMADLVGVARGGPPDLARRSSEVFRGLLQARAKAR